MINRIGFSVDRVHDGRSPRSEEELGAVIPTLLGRIQTGISVWVFASMFVDGPVRVPFRCWPRTDGRIGGALPH